jgi:AmmeMemoRadiSam system protein A
MKTVLNPTQQHQLLTIARQALEQYVRSGKPLAVKTQDQSLSANRAAFVTLKIGSKLRGCIGQLEADQPLDSLVASMAVAAGCHDPRFAPVSPEELNQITMAISVLSPLKKIADWRQVRCGQDGVCLELDGRKGVFLPEVATQNHLNRQQLLELLCTNKMDLPPTAYQDPHCRFYTFQCQTFQEQP